MGDDARDPLRFARDDDSAPHWPLIVPFSSSFMDFDPTRVPDQLSQSFYEQTFRVFLTGLDAVMVPNEPFDGARHD